VVWDLLTLVEAQLMGLVDTEGRDPNRTTARNHVGDTGFHGKE
jgi:hypothetical protein